VNKDKNEVLVLYNLGERLKEIRLSKGITLSQLERESRVSSATISRIERNIYSTSIDNLLDICDALKITIVDLLETKENLPIDMLNLISTAKKLSPLQRKKITEMIETFL
jgi:transcriptional regulator with XRE-family HTH domain